MQAGDLFGTKSWNTESDVIQKMGQKIWKVEMTISTPLLNTQKYRIFLKKTIGAEEPLALVLQKEYIDEPEPGKYIHIKETRLTEWSVEFLTRPRRTEKKIPDFYHLMLYQTN